MDLLYKNRGMDFQKQIWFGVISRVPTLMVNLKTLKNRVKLAVITSINPEVNYDTRWRSIYLMLRKYLNLVNDTDNFRRCSFDRVKEFNS